MVTRLRARLSRRCGCGRLDSRGRGSLDSRGRGRLDSHGCGYLDSGSSVRLDSCGSGPRERWNRCAACDDGTLGLATVTTNDYAVGIRLENL